MARGITSFRVPVDPILNFADRRSLATLLINLIISRTRAGNDIDGNPFTSYSVTYREELSEDGLDTTADLDITGEMLDNIELLDTGVGFIEIGLADGSFAADKARWNQGGNPKIPSRPFMGVTQNAIDVFEEQVIALTPAVVAQQFLERNNAIDLVFNQLGLDTVQSAGIAEGFEGITPNSEPNTRGN